MRLDKLDIQGQVLYFFWLFRVRTRSIQLEDVCFCANYLRSSSNFCRFWRAITLHDLIFVPQVRLELTLDGF